MNKTARTFPYYNIEKSLMTHLVGFINSEIIGGLLIWRKMSTFVAKLKKQWNYGTFTND